MPERALDAITLSYMTIFLVGFGSILLTVPRRRNLLDATLTAIVFMLAISYLRSLLGLYHPAIFDTPFARNVVRVIAMITITICVTSLWRELRRGAGIESDHGLGALQRQVLEHDRRLAQLEQRLRNM